MRKLIQELNKARNLYYNFGTSPLTDNEYDEKLEQLKKIEQQTGIVYSNSPTQEVGYPILNNLKKVKMNDKPMLSLEKVHSNEEINNFIGSNQAIRMIKCDGLSVRIIYENGSLVSANTRGDGYIGGDITEHIKYFTNVPLKISILNRYVIDGEAIIKIDDFTEINKNNTFKNPRNTAAGALNLLDMKEVEKRKLSFIAWDVIDGDTSLTFIEKINNAQNLGFEIVYFSTSDSNEEVLKKAKELNIPCDGVVWKFNDIKYGQSLGNTAHHFLDAIAWKPKNEIYPTTLRDIEWGAGRGDTINPVAIFDMIEFDDADVSRASLHNLSIINSIFGDDGPRRGQTIYISKRNMIIPCVESANPYPEGEKIEIPSVCPCCGSATAREADNESEFLICPNSQCPGKVINRIDYFAGKKGLDIKGLSEATIEKLIEWGWLNSCADIFTLNSYRNEWIKKPGFGPKSVDNILAAIEKSEICTLDKFICALGIPLIGATASKQLAKVFKNWNIFIEAVENGYKFYQIAGFGREMSQAITTFDFAEARFIAHNFITFKEDKNEKASLLEGKVYVITGKLYEMTREQLKDKIEQLGGKVTSAVSKKTTALICNEEEATSTKAVKARELGIPIITEKYFFAQLEN